MATNLGPLTSDEVPLDMLRTVVLDSVELHNEGTRDFISLWAGTPVKTSTVQARTRSMKFERSGSDTYEPGRQHLGRDTITLPDPVRWILKGGITREAWERGLASDEVLANYQEAVKADRRLVTETLFKACLSDGGWYDATVTPPPFKSNTFDGTHDHYLFFNVSGKPSLGNITDAKQTIIEHGFDDSIVLWLNSAQTSAMTKAVDTEDVDLSSPVFQKLQELGYTPSFSLAGVNIIRDDWVPEDYGLMLALGEKPLRWRVTDNPITRDLIAFDQATTPNAQYQWEGDFVRWTSAGVVARGAGVAIYFNGTSWTDPIFSV